MLEPGDPAPDFDLSGTTVDGELGTYRLSAAAQAGPVVLCFYPFDFGPACTQALQSIQNVDWREVTGALSVYGISPDGPHAHRAFAEEANLEFPLLVDRTAYVAEQFDALEDERRPGQPLVRLSTFVVDRRCRVVDAWRADAPDDVPDVGSLRSAVARASDGDGSRA